MSRIIQSEASNGLLRTLPKEELDALTRHCEWVELKLHEVLQESDEFAEFAYFPTSGICSIIAENGAGVRSETALIGREGFVGITILLHAESSPSRVVVQLEGRALRIRGSQLQRMLPRCPSLTFTLLRFTHVFGVQTSQTSVANSQYSVTERLARWLLMCQDRGDSSTVTMTHEFLSLMLSVRRPGITDALIDLEGKNIIHSSRNHIEIVNRVLLEKCAGGCYGVSESEYRRLLLSPDAQYVPSVMRG